MVQWFHKGALTKITQLIRGMLVVIIISFKWKGDLGRTKDSSLPSE